LKFVDGSKAAKAEWSKNPITIMIKVANRDVVLVPRGHVVG